MQLIDWLIDWLIGWLIGWLVCWLVDWLIDQLLSFFYCVKFKALEIVNAAPLPTSSKVLVNVPRIDPSIPYFGTDRKMEKLENPKNLQCCLEVKKDSGLDSFLRLGKLPPPSQSSQPHSSTPSSQKTASESMNKLEEFNQRLDIGIIFAPRDIRWMFIIFFEFWPMSFLLLSQI